MLNEFSTQMADAVAAASVSVVQVHGARRPVSGLVYATDVVLTTMRGVGQHDDIDFVLCHVDDIPEVAVYNGQQVSLLTAAGFEEAAAAGLP